MVVAVVGEVLMGVWGACRIGGGVSGRMGFG